MTIAYRTVEERYADAALAGQFLMRRLSYYRSKECPEERRDELEGSVLAQVDRWRIEKYDDSMKRTKESLRKMGVGIGDGVTMRNVTFENVNYQQVGLDSFVLCFSAVPGAGLSSGGRNVLLEVRDIEALARLLTEAHQADVGPFECRSVEYGSRSFDPRDAFLDPNPFIKEHRFSNEKEIRLVARALDDRKTLLTNCPTASTLIRRLSSPQASY